MLKNYFITALRVISRQKIISFINLAGLAIGMACFILIFMFIRYELSYDKYHKREDRIYRVVGDMNRNKIVPESAKTGPPMAPAMREDLRGVLNAVRIAPAKTSQTLVEYQNKRFNEKRVGYADAQVFEVFSFPLTQGNPKTALAAPNTVVISESIAKKYFGDENPLGKVLIVENDSEYQVTGVMKDIPPNSHFRFDFIVSFESLKKAYRGMYNCWTCAMAYSYLLLPQNGSPAEVEKQFPVFLEKHIGKQSDTGIRLRLQPLSEIHLSSGLANEIEPGTEVAYLYILATVGLSILLIACANYMNLTTALSGQRAKEIGIRKVIGANKGQLKMQFWAESITLALIAFPIALLLVSSFLSTFNNLVGKTLSLELTDNWMILFILIAVAITVGLVAGSYPAFFLSRFQPVKVLTNKVNLSGRGAAFRNTLVVFQFTISILFIITTAVIFNQLNFMNNKKLGFNKDHVVVLPILDTTLHEKYEPFRSELLQNASIVSVSAASQIPSEKLYELRFWPGGEKGTGKQKMKMVTVHYDYFETLEIEILKGRAFSPDFGTDVKEGFILNEAAAKAFGWENPVGRKFGSGWRGKKGEIIGVVRDFHFESLYQRIEPTVFFIVPFYNHVLVRIHGDNISETLAFLKEKWQEFLPHRPFEYAFLDARLDALYKKEEKLSRIFGYFATLTIIVASLGLFGLAAFAAQRRIKEAGIRKVFGAKVSHIITMLSKEFVMLVLIANIITWPIAYFSMSKWLQGFAYRVDIGLPVFVISGLTALFVALLAVIYPIFRVALTNPADVLRYE